MRLLASTAAPTNSSKRSMPTARQRFMPRPRNSTEMRPSMTGKIYHVAEVEPDLVGLRATLDLNEL
jgi:hypothetical protein